MAKVNVYLPDDLEQQVRDAGLSVSPICQAALREAVDRFTALGSATTDRRQLSAHTGRGRFTPRLTAVLAAAEEEAAGRTRQVTPLDLLAAIVDHGENLGARVLAAAGVELPAPGFRRRGKAAAKGRGELAVETRGVLASAFTVALDLRHDHVGTEHVVLAMAAGAGAAADLFTALGLDERTLRRHVERLIDNPWSTPSAEGPAEPDPALWVRLEAEIQRLAAEIDRLKDDRRG